MVEGCYDYGIQRASSSSTQSRPVDPWGLHFWQSQRRCPRLVAKLTKWDVDYPVLFMYILVPSRSLPFYLDVKCLALSKAARSFYFSSIQSK
ncbi:hypothetical protein Ae201684_018874 [Aphanomyces euteiches]|uniref:Uncharacterized protein n=1 Tax=Aphanomyces euteiches TaxID=100861 RepID=A0A6G0W4E7_9STRA|nr:hypothetical protein Ae201684_018874 [Aphanomyces euteiches]